MRKRCAPSWRRESELRVSTASELRRRCGTSPKTSVRRALASSCNSLAAEEEAVACCFNAGQSSDEFYLALKTYLRSGIPVVMRARVQDADLHALTLVGFREWTLSRYVGVLSWLLDGEWILDAVYDTTDLRRGDTSRPPILALIPRNALWIENLERVRKVRLGDGPVIA